VWQDIVRIDQSIRKKAFHKSEIIRASMQHAIDGNGRLHLLGLVRLFMDGQRWKLTINN
jgi:2,3-bisphosphoglycerate-independent phosphoglycerate mutase